MTIPTLGELEQSIADNPGKAIAGINVLREFWGDLPQERIRLALADLDRMESEALRSIADAAIEVCRNLIADRESCGIDESDSDDPLAKLVRDARAAVAKAEGAIK